MRCPHIHLHPELLNEAFTAHPEAVDRNRRSNYDHWLQKYWSRSDESKEPFIAWHAARYDSRLPIWAAVEIMEFGQVVRLCRGLALTERDAIARDLGLQARTLASWVAALNGLRNACAHRARAWNRTLLIAPALPKRIHVPALDHMHDLHDRTQKRIYVPAAALAWFLTSRGLRPGWVEQLRASAHGVRTSGTDRALIELGGPLSGWSERKLSTQSLKCHAMIAPSSPAVTSSPVGRNSTAVTTRHRQLYS